MERTYVSVIAISATSSYPIVGMQRVNRGWGLTWRITAYNAPWPRIVPESHARCSISRRERYRVFMNYATETLTERSNEMSQSHSCYKIQQFILAIFIGTVLRVSLRCNSPKDRQQNIFIIFGLRVNKLNLHIELKIHCHRNLLHYTCEYIIHEWQE